MLQNFTVPEDLSAYYGIELQVKGDGRLYKLIIQAISKWDTTNFDTTKGGWQSVRYTILSISSLFVPVT
jgi:hypothetical protein